jgi:CRISPR-associated protein Csb2
VDRLLKISLTFPRGYEGDELGTPEDLPSAARLHEALVAAAAGGPWAEVGGRELSPCPEHRRALEWLEEHEPVGMSVPLTCLTTPTAQRFRRRASPVTLAGTRFEALSTLDGPVTWYWPEPPEPVVQALRQIAPEVTHVGRADSIAIVRVDVGTREGDHGRYHVMTRGRGPGRVVRIPTSGRLAALEDAHRSARKRGSHSTGSMGKQAADVYVTGGNETATALRRLEPAAETVDWPFEEVWSLDVTAPQWAAVRLQSAPFRVAGAVAIHRALVRRIGTDVPAFITGRDGDGPLRGAGHLAIHLWADPLTGKASALFAVPRDVAPADRMRLVNAFGSGLRVRLPGIGWAGLGEPSAVPASEFWSAGRPSFTATSEAHTATPLVLDTPGVPRRGPWSLNDAVVCSIGYAFRGVLERADVEWGSGWAFRRELVDLLRREYGVEARAWRVPESASRYVHRASEGDLLVAVDAVVELGRLASPRGGFIALGRARHLGGGLLMPRMVEKEGA